MVDVMDEISVTKIDGSGHYVLSAFVKDGADCFLHSLQFYFYDWDEIDEMKAAYLQHLEQANLCIQVD